MRPVIEVRNISSEITPVEKLTFTVMPDALCSGRTKVSVEILSRKGVQLQFSFPSDNDLPPIDRRDFYQDKRACEMLIRGYETLEKDEQYAQKVKRHRITFSAPQVNIKQIASDDEGSRKSYNITIPEPDGDLDAVAAWIEFDISSPKMRLGRVDYRVEFDARGIVVNSMYPLVVLPKGYRLAGNALSSFCELENDEQKDDDTLMTIQVDKNWPSFHDWKAVFQDRVVVKPKKLDELPDKHTMKVQIHAVSDVNLAAFQLLSFGAAFLSAIFAGALVNYAGEWLYSTIDNSCWLLEDKISAILPRGDGALELSDSEALVLSELRLSLKKCPPRLMMYFAGGSAILSVLAACLSFYFSRRASGGVE